MAVFISATLNMGGLGDNSSTLNIEWAWRQNISYNYLRGED